VSSARFIEEVRGDDPDLASYLRIEEREFEAGGLLAAYHPGRDVLRYDIIRASREEKAGDDHHR
jgi:hypothetical protein